MRLPGTTVPNRFSNSKSCVACVRARRAEANRICSATSRGQRSLIATKVFSLSASISWVVTRCNRTGQMDTVQAFIALLTCADSGRLPAERPAIRLQLICEPADEDGNSVALPFVVRSGHLHCFERARRKSSAKNECDPGQESRDCAVYLGSSVEPLVPSAGS